MKTEQQPIIRKTQAGFSNTLSRLKVGHRVMFSGHECRVAMVNDCRARLVPLTRKAVKIETLDGKEVNFERPMEGYNVSPNSSLDIIGFDP
jgi:hypothetical protein